MRSYLELAGKPCSIVFVLILTYLLSAWTCSGVLNFDSCPDAVPQPQITALSPGNISAVATSVLLSVEGSGFVPQSKILWNGNPLGTSFVDSHHLEATITQETFDWFGGTAAGSALISVKSPGSGVIKGCSNGGVSGTLDLDIN